MQQQSDILSVLTLDLPVPGATHPWLTVLRDAVVVALSAQLPDCTAQIAVHIAMNPRFVGARYAPGPCRSRRGLQRVRVDRQPVPVVGLTVRDPVLAGLPPNAAMPVGRKTAQTATP